MALEGVRCPYCGATNPADESNCSRCGKALKPSFADRKVNGWGAAASLPFQCHICGRRFGPDFRAANGGICSRCGKPACHSCLAKTFIFIYRRPSVCKRCAGS